MIEYLNANSGAFTVIFTGVVTISTVVYAVLTAILVKETSKMRRAQTEPKVEMVVKSSEHWISLMRLHIKNIGLGPAYNVTFNVSSTADKEGGQALIKDLTRANLFKKGLAYLGPGQEIIAGYSVMTQGYERKIEAVLNFKVGYRDCTQKNYSDSFNIDFTEFKGGSQIGTPPIYSISQSLEKIEKTLDQIATGWRRMKVDVFSQHDRDQERKEWEKESQSDQIE